MGSHETRISRRPQWRTHLNLYDALLDILGSAIKRLLAHTAEHLLEVVISTRKASMPSAYDLPELFRA